MNVNSPAATAIAWFLKGLGIFFEVIDVGWVSADARIKLLREEDAREVADAMRKAGYTVDVNGREVRARIGAA